MSASPSPIRVRSAPSPTGNLHVGTARAALFNYLFAKRYGGTFILRIEDTDVERSDARFVQNIFDSLRAIGIAWDEGPEVGGPCGPYHQSERLVHYREFANKLLEAGLAYPAYETPEELEEERERAKTEGRTYVYRRPTPEVLARQKMDPVRRASLRFKMPDQRGDIVFTDLVRGEIRFDSALTGDFVILKSSGIPTYNFAVVVDDILMRISHVIRGEDHISNTPRQILLYEALAQIGLAPRELPAFAHMSMILAPDRTKLSKRHGATAVSEFIRQGYLPEAFCNFLALLGWSPPDGEEIGTLDHFARLFSLDRVAQSPAIFEMDKLNFLNKHTIRHLDIRDLLARVKPYLGDYDLTQYPEEKLLMMLDAVREPMTTLADVPGAVDYFFGPQVMLDAQTVGEVLLAEEAHRVLAAFRQDFLARADFSSPEKLSAGLKAFIEALKPLKAKAILWPLRVALTGRTHGADMAKTLYILGRETVENRLQSALNLISHPVG